jgi:FkbM family methyltransferase
MKTLVKKQIASILKNFGIGITWYKTLEELRRNSSAIHDIKVLRALSNEKNAHQLLMYFGSSKSQLRQDLFALSYLDFKKNGYFVEFGATNGVDLSNTYLMEKELGWNGILAEPATVWHKDLKKNRKCNIENNCIWKDSNSNLTFNQVAVAELSTISSYSDTDLHKEARKEGKTYNVKTISLEDLLLKYNAPHFIDYLSIDTEGSEYEILNNFNFSQYTFGVITCEHNFTLMREKIYSLLTKQGYQRVFEDLSLFDDWYVKPTQPQL